MALSNYGEAFAKNVLRKFYANAITPVIANTDYEGEIKSIGDRVNVLMFLDNILLSDYAVGSDMSVQHPTDTESYLQIDQQKYYDFDIDKVDKAFTYVDDEDSTLIENAAKGLEKIIDQRLLDVYIEEVKAGNRVPKKETDGTWTFCIGTAGTSIAITTAASYGIATLTGASGSNQPTAEMNYFPIDCAGRGFRLMSDTYNTPWYRISSRVSSTVIWFTNWDGGTAGDFCSASYVKGMYGADKYKPSGTAGWGGAIEGMKATQATSSNVYALVCELATALDNNDIPTENRHLTVPPWFKNLLVQASQLQPDIAMYHQDVVLNGKVGRVGGFDVHMVSDDRFSTDASSWGALHTEATKYFDTTGYKILANHTGFITFAHKFAESRVIDAQAQFSKLYQGLNLYGFKVLPMRRKCGAYLFCYA